MAGTIGITGGKQLYGTVCVQGSKNAALPVLAASLLHRGVTVLHNCPEIADVAHMLHILRHLGCGVERAGHTVKIDASGSICARISEKIAGNMRGLIFFLGALIGRKQEALLPYPGGCVIGARPIDLHVGGLRELGVSVTEKEARVLAAGRPKGGCVQLPTASVGATENLLMAAAGADGATVVSGCACEPEITALCGYLSCIGADISGAGTQTIRISPIGGYCGKTVEYTIPGDRIVAGTCALAVIGCGGAACIRGVSENDLRGQLDVFRALGAKAEYAAGEHMLRIQAPAHVRALAHVQTAPYPGFPTDLQSQLLAVLTKAQGESTVTEGVFEQRFKIVEQLRKMGAAIHVSDNCATVCGPAALHGACVEAQELRGGAGLVIAGLMAEGRSEITGIHFLERGYENICRDFQMLGAQIE